MEIEDKIYKKIKEKDNILYHSADLSLLNEICEFGLQPNFGDWRKEILIGACDNDLYNEILNDSNNEITFFDLSPSWISMKVSRKIKKRIHDVTWNDIAEHGLLAIVIPNETNEDFFIKYGNRGTIQFDNKEFYPYNLITKEKIFDEVPFGVEPGDIYTHEVIDPNFILHGKSLVNFLKNYFPQENILKENKVKKNNLK